MMHGKHNVKKNVGDYQYGIKYILPKCILWFTIYYNLMHVYGTYYILTCCVIGSTGDMSAHTINQLATWMIEHPCIDSVVVQGREDDSGRSSVSDILLCRAQVIYWCSILQVF